MTCESCQVQWREGQRCWNCGENVDMRGRRLFKGSSPNDRYSVFFSAIHRGSKSGVGK